MKEGIEDNIYELVELVNRRLSKQNTWLVIINKVPNPIL